MVVLAIACGFLALACGFLPLVATLTQGGTHASKTKET